ncbi:MAG: bifunctional ornithine acetyltransferase/N-acetylglutamate synthase, partial [Lachnospiraceae bacterium]|nr:bifunctional ornithine acetyltransferase/N-acetylglutamate synthase [Lachnospiraceae bacterium]
MEICSGGAASAKGFYVSSTKAGIKYQGRLDMAAIFSDTPCIAAAAFTTNIVKAAPVKYDRQIVDNSPFIRAVIINTGIANACTGADGMAYCEETAKEAAKVFDVPESSVLVASTGVIGMSLPIDRIVKGIGALKGELADSIEAQTQAAKAIMTTDTKEKQACVKFMIGGKEVTIGGM